jgi:DNA-binding MarR family transcriptional regulator
MAPGRFLKLLGRLPLPMTTQARLQLTQRPLLRNPHQEAFLNIVRTADALEREVETLCKRFGITRVQYNVLRILDDVEGGRSCSSIGRRLAERHTDVTRLLDRMENAGLIRRQRSSKDRRAVNTTITLAGKIIVRQLARPLDALHQQQFAKLSEAQVLEVIEGMEKIRARVA